MKKIALSSLLIFLLAISTFSGITSASGTIEFPSSSKLNNQLFGYFMQDLYHKEIISHIQSYYKNKNINGYGLPENEESVFIQTTRNIKGLDEDVKENFSYMLKITVLPSNNNGTVVGKDTLYFAVEPLTANVTKLPKGITTVKLIKYDHKKVQSK